MKSEVTRWRLHPNYEEKQIELHPKKYTYSTYSCAVLELYIQQEESQCLSAVKRQKMLLGEDDAEDLDRESV